jgi:hypothetical protein
MFHLWSLAEQDLLAENVPYRLRDTGQGLNRVQAAPKTSRMMHSILHRAQKSLGMWVGSSVIHMGDRTCVQCIPYLIPLNASCRQRSECVDVYWSVPVLVSVSLFI